MGKIKMNCNWLQSVGSVVDKNSKKVYYTRKEEVIQRVFFFITVEVKVEMALKVENYNYTKELENKSSPQYKAIERNFTDEV